MVKKYLSFILLCVVLSIAAKAQYVSAYNNSTVILDYLHGEFNGNQPLPAEEYFVVKGAISPAVSMIKLDILRNTHSRDTLYANLWRRAYGNTDGAFNLPVHYKLRGNDRYTFVFIFYRSLSDSEKVHFRDAVQQNLQAYIQGIMEVSNNKFSLQSSTRRMQGDLNRVVDRAFTYYSNGFLGNFPGFSDVVKNKLEQISDTRLRKAKYNVESDKGDYSPDVRRRYAEQLQSELLQICMSEVDPYIGGDLMVMQDIRSMQNYPTEKTRTVLAVNAGYGAVYLSGNWGDLSYDTQPYVGLSFPLGNHKFNRFMGNTSISTGIFLRNFHDENNKKITGPVIGLPFYLGIGYKAFRFIRLNAGLVATSQEKTDLQDTKFDDVKLKPFVGISAELNLWLGTER